MDGRMSYIPNCGESKRKQPGSRPEEANTVHTVLWPRSPWALPDNGFLEGSHWPANLCQPSLLLVQSLISRQAWLVDWAPEGSSMHLFVLAGQ
jgi:hypothetical protein